MSATTELPDAFASTLQTIHERVPEKLRTPQIAIVCGSGLSTLAESIRDKVIIPYADLDGFVASTVSGQISSLAFGLVGDGEGVPVVAMLGRVSRRAVNHIRYFMCALM
jgi:purine-nucleoside phosphorylase